MFVFCLLTECLDNMLTHFKLNCDGEPLSKKNSGWIWGKIAVKIDKQGNCCILCSCAASEKTGPLSAISRLMNSSYLSEYPACISLVSFYGKERW